MKLGSIVFPENAAKFHPTPSWNDGALGFLKTVAGHPNKNNKEKNKMSSDMRSVADLNMSKGDVRFNKFLWVYTVMLRSVPGGTDADRKSSDVVDRSAEFVSWRNYRRRRHRRRRQHHLSERVGLRVVAVS